MYSESLMKRAQETIEKQALGGILGAGLGYARAPEGKRGEGLARGFTRGTMTELGADAGGLLGGLGGGLGGLGLGALLQHYGYGGDDIRPWALGGAAAGGGAGLLGGGVGGYHLGGKLLGNPSWEQNEDADETGSPSGEESGKKANDGGFQSTVDEAGGGEGGATSLSDASGTSLSGPAPISPMTGPAGAAGGPIPAAPMGMGPSPVPAALPATTTPLTSNMPSPAMNMMSQSGNMGMGGNMMGKLGQARELGATAGRLAARIAYRNR